jgi:hypothetical protein
MAASRILPQSFAAARCVHRAVNVDIEAQEDSSGLLER